MTDQSSKFLSLNQEGYFAIDDLVASILRRRYIVIISWATVFGMALFYSFLTKPVYEASSTLYIKSDNQSMSLERMLAPNGQTRIQAEMEILRSRTIAEQVVRSLNLIWSIESSRDNASCRIIGLDAPVDVKELVIEMSGPDTYDLLDAKGRKIATGMSDRICRIGSIRLQAKLFGKKGDRFELTRTPFNQAVRDLRNTTSVNESGRQSDVITVSYQHTDPELARNIVNALVQAYLDQSLAFKTQEASKTVSFIEEQLLNVRDDLNRAETTLKDYKSGTGVVQLDAEAQDLITRFSLLEQQRVGVNLMKRQIDFALASQRESLADGKSYIPAVMKDDPLVAGMATELVSLEVQKRTLMVEYTANHPAVQSVQVQIDEIQQKIRNAYRTSIANLSKQESDISASIESYENQLKDMPAKELDLMRYTRLAKVSGDIYTFLLQKHEEARLQKASTISNINVIDTAITPDMPVKPDKKKTLFIGFICGMLIGTGLSLLVDYFDNTIKSETEAKSVLGMSHLVTIPFIASEKNPKNEEINLATIVETDPRSSAAEAFRSLRTGLHFSAVNMKRQILVLTSAFAGEGKSTISSNLAITMAQVGARTVLIDADLHKSTLHLRLGLKRVPGLSEVLAGDAGIDAVLQSTSTGNLWVIAAGTMPPNPSALLGSSAMQAMLAELASRFDQIIIDAPPTLPVSDSIVLATIADQMLIVIEAGRVPAKAAARFGELLRNSQAPVAGFVYNNKTLKVNGYGYSENYGYGYGYGDSKQA